MKRQIRAKIGTIVKERLQYFETVFVNTNYELALKLNLVQGQIIFREYIYTFASEAEAVAYFKVLAIWALENGRRKLGESGGTFYGYEVAKSGETTVRSNF